MPGFVDLLRRNRNYRSAWTGQVVSEIGDHFNNIAVFSLALATTHSGLVVSGVMLSRAIPLFIHQDSPQYTKRHLAGSV